MMPKFTVGLLVLAFLMPAITHAAEAGTANPRVVVETILGAPHGLSKMSGPEVEAALQQVLKAPEEYTPLFAAAVAPDTSQLQRHEYVSHVGIAVEVLQRIGTAQAESALAERFSDWDTLVGDTAIKKDALRNAILLRNGIVKALGASGSVLLVEPVLAGLKDTDVASYHVYMKYLQDVAGKTTEIIERVRDASVRAGRQDWPITKQTLQKLEQSVAPAETEQEPVPKPPVSSAEQSPNTAEAPVSGWGTMAVWSLCVMAGLAALLICFHYRRRK